MTFDKKLNFKKHVEDLYKKANQKVNRCTGYIRDEGTPRYIWTSTKEKSLKVHLVQKGPGYTKLQMDICKGQKTPGTQGT